jgi:hypothetical protein
MYVVRRGDNLWDLAQRFLGDGRRWHELKGYTGDPRRMPIGTVIRLPSESSPPANPPTSAGAGGPPPLSWDNFPAEYKNQLMAMEHEYEAANGFRVPVSDQQLLQMAQNGITSMFDFAQGMWAGAAANLKEAMPGMQFGLDHDTFTAAIQQLGDYYQQTTGQVAPADLLASALQSGKGKADMQAFQTQLKTDEKMKAAFPWIKYGMNFEQFGQFKDEQKSAFGRVLTDKEAGAALTDQHEHATRGTPSEAVIQGSQYSPRGKTAGDAQAAVR